MVLILLWKRIADFSTYTLDIPSSSAFPTFHASLLRKFVPNDPELFPSHKFSEPGPILTANGLEEHFVDCVVDERKRGRGKQYLVSVQRLRLRP